MSNNRANLRNRVLGGGSSGGSSSGSSPTQDEAELANQAGEPNPQSQDSFTTSGVRPRISKGDFNRSKPPKDRMRRYWRQFETTPIIREPITSFARQVVEPGYRVEAPVLTEDEIDELEQWLQNAAIVEGKSDRDVLKLLKKAAVQREVRGTALIEKVPAREDSDILYGVKLVNAETMEVNTMPRQAMLLPPKRPSEIFDDNPRIDITDVPTTDDGLAAAYQQDVTTNRWRSSGEFTQYWTAEQIIPLTRDADVGEIFGTSRIESVSARIEGLKKKLQDNDEAIASKAYPLWLFMFGSEEQPWERDDIDRFMNAHDMENFQPGLKQGVRGDVNVETISGEVADIAEYLQFDLDYILTAMPMPKYTLGAFESQINQFVSQSQERDIQRQLKESRREMEAEFSEVVQEKAKEMFNLTDEDMDKVNFKMGRPDEQEQDVGPNQNVIDYRGEGQGTDGNGDNSGDSGNVNQGQQNNDEQEPDGEQSESDEEDDEEENIWTAELADPRFVGTNPNRRKLTSSIDSVFEAYLDNVVSRLRGQYRDAPRNAMTQIDTINTRARSSVIRSSDLRDVSPSVMEKTVQDTLRTLQNNTKLDYEADYNTTHRNNVSQFSQNVERAVDNALDDLAKKITQKVTRGAQSGEEMQNIIERIKATFTKDRLRQRAQLIAHMEMQSAVNTTKLIEFENHDDVVGVQAINTCDEKTTPVCRDLAGCGDGERAIARFDEDATISKQWMEQVDRSLLHQGFDPLPQAPPWHFGCDTEIVPVVENEAGEELTHATPEGGSVFTLEKLEDKYGIEVAE